MKLEVNLNSILNPLKKDLKRLREIDLIVTPLIREVTAIMKKYETDNFHSFVMDESRIQFNIGALERNKTYLIEREISKQVQEVLNNGK